MTTNNNTLHETILTRLLDDPTGETLSAAELLPKPVVKPVIKPTAKPKAKRKAKRKTAPVQAQTRAKGAKLSTLIDLSASKVENKYRRAFEAIGKAGVDRMPALLAKRFAKGIKCRLVISSKPEYRRQVNIVTIGKPDIEHAYTLTVWVGHPDYAKAVESKVWTTVTAHIMAAFVECLYRANTLKFRSDADSGGKITEDASDVCESIGITKRSRVGKFRGSKGLEAWTTDKVISKHLSTLAEMYVPKYTPKPDTPSKKTTVTLVCVAGCKLTDATTYGIRVQHANVNDYTSLLRCAHHPDTQFTIKDED